MSELIKENESDLIDGLNRGSVKVFDLIYRKYCSRIYRFSLKCLRNKEDAEEILQIVFMNLWRKHSEIVINKDLDSYIFSIALNAIRKHFRCIARERNFQTSILVNQRDYDDSTNTDIEFEDMLRHAQKAINKLPPQQKAVYLLSKKENYSNEEISDLLNISKKTVENHLCRAKSFLKSAILEKEKLKSN